MSENEAYQKISGILDALTIRHYADSLRQMPKGDLDKVGGLEHFKHSVVGKFANITSFANKGNFAFVRAGAKNARMAITNHFAAYMDDALPGINVATAAFILMHQDNYPDEVDAIREVLPLGKLFTDSYNAINEVLEIALAEADKSASPTR